MLIGILHPPGDGWDVLAQDTVADATWAMSLFVVGPVHAAADQQLHTSSQRLSQDCRAVWLNFTCILLFEPVKLLLEALFAGYAAKVGQGLCSSKQFQGGKPSTHADKLCNVAECCRKSH